MIPQGAAHPSEPRQAEWDGVTYSGRAAGGRPAPTGHAPPPRPSPSRLPLLPAAKPGLGDRWPRRATTYVAGSTAPALDPPLDARRRAPPCRPMDRRSQDLLPPAASEGVRRAHWAERLGGPADRNSGPSPSPPGAQRPVPLGTGPSGTRSHAPLGPRHGAAAAQLLDPRNRRGSLRRISVRRTSPRSTIPSPYREVNHRCVSGPSRSRP